MTKIKIEIAYANPTAQAMLPLDVAEGTDVRTAIEASGILDRFPEIDLEQNKVGIYSKPCKLDQVLRDGDRIEIYRPLIADPKESRRARAAKKEEAK